MAGVAIDCNCITATAGECVRQRLFRIKLLTALIQRHDFKVAPETNLPGVGLQLPHKQLQQCTLSDTVRSDNSN